MPRAASHLSQRTARPPGGRALFLGLIALSLGGCAVGKSFGGEPMVGFTIDAPESIPEAAAVAVADVAAVAGAALPAPWGPLVVAGGGALATVLAAWARSAGRHKGWEEKAAEDNAAAAAKGAA